MTNLEWIRTLSVKELSDLLYDYWLPRGQYAWADSRKGLMKVLSENHIERDCAKCKHQNNCYCIKGYGCPYEPIAEQTEPQTEVNALYDQIVEDIDTRVKCANAKKVEDEPHTDCAWK